MLKEFAWGPVRGQKHHARMSFLPLTPLENLLEHTFLNLLNTHYLYFSGEMGLWILRIRYQGRARVVWKFIWGQRLLLDLIRYIWCTCLYGTPDDSRACHLFSLQI